MIFRADLAKAIIAGRKTQTRRRVSDNPRSPWYRKRCLYRPGRIYAVCPGRGKKRIAEILIVEARRTWLGSISDEEAIAEGFEDRYAFLDAWGQINGALDLNEPVWALRFAVI